MLCLQGEGFKALRYLHLQKYIWYCPEFLAEALKEMCAHYQSLWT